MDSSYHDALKEILNPRVVTKKLECPICLGVLRDPVATPCEHWFCADCIKQVLQSRPGACPYCRRKLKSEPLRPADRLIVELVSDVAVPCVNQSAGCHWVGPKRNRPDHEKACLVSQVLAWQREAASLEVAMSKAAEKISDLRAELANAEKIMLELEYDVNALKLQAGADSITIGDLRQQQVILEKELAEKDSLIASLRASLVTPVVEEASVQCGMEQSDHSTGCLLVASEKGDIAAVRQILDGQDGISSHMNAVTTAKCQSALHLAVLFGHSSIAENLLGSEHFEAINARDRDGNTALHLACLHGREDIAQMLISDPRFQAVSLKNGQGYTELHCAALEGHSHAARLLLGADRFSDTAVKATVQEELTSKRVEEETLNESGLTALHLAAKYGHVAVADVLLNSPRFSTSDHMTVNNRFTALHIAALYGSACVAESLLQSARFAAVSALSKTKATALHCAAAMGRVAVIHCLLPHPRFTEASRQESMYGHTAFHSAAFHDTNAVRAFLDSQDFPEASVNVVDRSGCTALHLAIRSGSIPTVQAMLEHAKVSTDPYRNVGGPFLHSAAFFGHESITLMLLAHPRVKRLGLQNKSGDTALHVAALQGHVEVARALLQAESYPNETVNAGNKSEGATALHTAVEFRRLHVVQLLLASPRFSAVNNVTTKDGRSALHIAATKGDADIVSALLESRRFGLDSVRAADRYGKTALHILTEHGHVEAAEELRSSGKFTSIATRCNNGRLALDIARAKDDAKMERLLKSWERELEARGERVVNFAPSALLARR